MSSRFLVPPVFLSACVLITCGCQSQPGPPATIVAQAQPPAPRSISVTGTAEIKTAPDEFVISVGADSFAAEATAAKETNDRVMSGLLAVTRAAGVDAKDVRT